MRGKESIFSGPSSIISKALITCTCNPRREGRMSQEKTFKEMMAETSSA
jgi:hypothetical protein